MAQDVSHDLYGVLGVPRDADEDAIKKAYRKLAGKHHPDRNPGASNEQRFKDINRAYEVLSDKGKRALYDEFGAASLQQGFDPDRARWAKQAGGGPRGGGGMPFNVEEMFAGGFGGFGDLFGGRGRRGPRKGEDVEASATIELSSALRGTMLQLTRPEGGEPVTVRIPPGASEGSRVRVPGQGGPGIGGGPPGDLVIKLHVLPHPQYRREGDDLHVDVHVSLVEAFRGEKIKIPTPDGEVSLKVPKRAQTGQVTRLKGKGVARKGREPGDLYVRFLVEVPTSDDPEVERLVAALEPYLEPPKRDLKL